MVRRRGHGANTVITSRESTSHGSLEQAVSITSVVDAFEEGELGGVRGRRGGEAVAKVLYADVGVTDDLSRRVEVLGCGVVGTGRVGEGAGC